MAPVLRGALGDKPFYVDFNQTKAHVLKSWNFLILQMDGFLANYRAPSG